ncbi:hypothetical protein ACOMHN_008621 [Nucella lapillus]
MKFALVLLVLLPVVLSKSVDTRGLGFLGFDHLVDIPFIKQKAQEILNDIGSSDSLERCKTSCHNILASDPASLIHTVCTPLCRSFQTIIHLFNLHPQYPPSSTAAPSV